MKILFYRYGSICEPDLIEEFQKIGFEVDTICNEITDKGLSSSKRVELVSNMLSQDSYSFLFGINFFPAISDLCEIYHIPYVSWIVDAPLLELFSISIKNTCNRIFCFDKVQYETIASYNPSGIFHLPLGTNVARWDMVISAINSEDIQNFSSDISFVGSLYQEKDPYLKAANLDDFTLGYVDALMAAQSQIVGSNILKSSLNPAIIASIKKALPEYFSVNAKQICNTDSFTCAQQILGFHCSSLERISIIETLSKYFTIDLYTNSDTSCFLSNKNIRLKGSVKTLTEMPKVFNLSKINLNMTIHSIESGISLRVWDVLGCGGFLISNYQEELFDYFEPGVDFDYYVSVEDLIEKCSFYLNNDEVRKKIALSGYEKVKKYHTYTNRMPQIISSIVK